MVLLRHEWDCRKAEDYSRLKIAEADFTFATAVLRDLHYAFLVGDAISIAKKKIVIAIFLFYKLENFLVIKWEI